MSQGGLQFVVGRNMRIHPVPGIHNLTCPPVVVLQIRCAMVTGDHLRTAVSVAHQCGLLPTGRPVLLVDGRPGADTNAAAPGVRLSVLYPDGSVNDHVQNSVVVPEVGCLQLFLLLDADDT